MNLMQHRRLIVPATALGLGSVIAVGAWIGSGWSAALGIEVIAVAGAAVYYALGGRDSDVGALFGSRPDERQSSVGLKSTALTGNVMILVAIGGLVVASAVGGPVWPFVLFCVAGGTTYVIGILVFRNG